MSFFTLLICPVVVPFFFLNHSKGIWKKFPIPLLEFFPNVLSDSRQQGTTAAHIVKLQITIYCTVPVKCKLPVASRFSRDETLVS